jgi:hypothetical protein
MALKIFVHNVDFVTRNSLHELHKLTHRGACRTMVKINPYTSSTHFLHETEKLSRTRNVCKGTFKFYNIGYPLRSDGFF